MNSSKKLVLILQADKVKRSKRNRELFLYCPYLIYRETGISMSYKEPKVPDNIVSVNDSEAYLSEEVDHLDEDKKQETKKAVKQDETRHKRTTHSIVQLSSKMQQH